MTENRTSAHILNTSANLLGFCLFVITALHITNKAAASYVDEVASVIAVLLGMSCLLSFYAIRTRKEQLSIRLERIADYLFITSLCGIMLVVMFIFLFVLQ